MSQTRHPLTVTTDAAAEIERLTDLWRDRLLAIAANTAHKKPSEDRWSISEVIGHLVDSACNNHQRFVRAQTTDALVFPKYEQNDWVSAANYRQCDWPSLVTLWCVYNQMLAGLSDVFLWNAWRSRARSRPATPARLRFLLRTTSTTSLITSRFLTRGLNPLPTA